MGQSSVGGRFKAVDLKIKILNEFGEAAGNIGWKRIPATGTKKDRFLKVWPLFM